MYIVENPDGPVCLAVDNENPYKNISDINSGENKIAVSFGTTTLYLDQHYVQHMSNLHKIAFFVRFISVLDWEFNLIKYIVTGEFIFLFVSFFGILGYLGAVKYNVAYLYAYSTYQGLMMLLETVFATVMVYWKYALHKKVIDASIVVLYLTSITQIACIFYNLKLIQLINYCKTNTQVPISPKYKIHNYDVYSYNQHNQESQEESLP